MIAISLSALDMFREDDDLLLEQIALFIEKNILDLVDPAVVFEDLAVFLHASVMERLAPGIVLLEENFFVEDQDVCLEEHAKCLEQ